ncbi:MAG: two pore domain potassium channel family protein [Alphaproteobacteria bacterium]|nr:two pore domain potassium channel family protein [Alphaproteobacteria bacterium]
MDRRGRRLKTRTSGFATGVVATAALLLLIAIAVSGDVGLSLASTMVASALASVAVFAFLFPGSTFFSLALTNSIAVYVSIFVFLSETNFRGVSPAAQHAGFLLPVAGFVVGAILRRDAIRIIVTQRQIRSAADRRRSLSWLLPTAALCALTFLVPGIDPTGRAIDVTFVLAMGGVSVLVLITAQNVAVFLLDAGLLFEEFFERVERLIMPVYAFLTFYSMIVVAFASIYKIVDRFVPGPHFRILDHDRAIGFADAIYFSVVTLSTVGYGDILPISEPIKLIALIEVVFGVTLLLVGFSEIMAYSREVQARKRDHGAAEGDE